MLSSNASVFLLPDSKLGTNLEALCKQIILYSDFIITHIIAGKA